MHWIITFRAEICRLKIHLSKNRSLLLLVILLLPLFYINVKDSHDWGDDFAQYFIQARNILENNSQTDNGLVFDRETGEYALKAYPVGFPLILAVSWLCFGDSILVSSLALSFFFFAFGIVSFFYFRKYFSEAISILLTLIIIYNPLTIGFKREILSDVPFSFFFLLGVLLFQSDRKNILYFMVTGIVWGMALSIRGMGATLFLAAGFLLVSIILNIAMKKEKKDQLFFLIRKGAVVAFSALLFYLLLNAVLFPIPSTGILQFYADAMSGENFVKWLALNYDYYYHVFLNFFATMGENFQWVSTISKYLLVALLPFGIIVAWFRKAGYDDWLFLAYLLILFIYPYLGGGFRFLLPVMPLMMKYIFTGFSSVISLAKVKSSVPAAVFLFIILIQYTPGIIGQVKSMDYSEQGPQEAPAVEAFQYIGSMPDDAVVVFLKPRALSYYSGKRAAYVARNVKPEEIRDLFRRMNAHYFLLCSQNEEVYDAILLKFIEAHKSDLRSIWKNESFELYTDLPEQIQ